MRLIVSSTGNDRAWARVTLDDRRRADLYSQTARLGRLIAERGAPVAAGAAALLTFASNLSIWQILGSAIAAQAAFAQLPLAEVGAYWVARTVHLALNRGVVLRTPEAIDTAGRVTAAVFCARGTLLLGEPEIACIEAFGQLTPQRVLELAAGAQMAPRIPRPRQSSEQPGSAVCDRMRYVLTTAAPVSASPRLLPTGNRWIVGSRGLMLREHVSVALAEQKISDLEALGQTVLLVAVGGRTRGNAWSSGRFAAGCSRRRAAPARCRCRAHLAFRRHARHLRGDRARPRHRPRAARDHAARPRGRIRRLTEGGAVAAVIGRSPVDDNALANGDVSVSLATAGSGSAEWQIQLVSDDVRDAAFAIRLAHRCRTEVRLSLALVCGSAGLATLVVSLGLVPLSAAPVLGFIGGTLALARWQMARE
ncbi:MAG: hypothetical protein QM784_39915 [Polyangiaceae bacterium]